MYNEREYIHFSSINEANSKGALDTIFCIYEMPIGGIIEYDNNKLEVLGYLKKKDKMVCKIIDYDRSYDLSECSYFGKGKSERSEDRSEKILIDSSENAKYLIDNYQYYDDDNIEIKNNSSCIIV